MSLRVGAVVPTYDGRNWLEGCLRSLRDQEWPFSEIVVVDDASSDGTADWLAEAWPGVRVVALERNRGFAVAANSGVAAVSPDCDAVALVNNDVELAPDWLGRTAAALEAHPEAAAVACKMVDLADATLLYDAGDVLRRDGVCEQRGRFERDDGRFDAPGEVFGACAGAALYRREAVAALGGFDERYWAYLEDVDLALRLRLAGWSCRYEPAVARHAGEGSSAGLSRPVGFWVERNTLLLVAKWFPLGWLPYVAYRQLGWAWHALLERRLWSYLRGAAAVVPLLPRALLTRRGRRTQVPIRAAVPPAPLRAR